MAAIRPRWRSVTRSVSITSPARLTACRSHASPPRKPRSARRSAARRRQRSKLVRNGRDLSRPFFLYARQCDASPATVIARSTATKQSRATRAAPVLLRCARNDGVGIHATRWLAMTVWVSQLIVHHFSQRDLYQSDHRAVYQQFRCRARYHSEILRDADAHQRLTPSQPKFDNNKKDRIARMY